MQEPQTIQCSSCGQVAPRYSTYCPSCGHSLQVRTQSQSQSQPTRRNDPLEGTILDQKYQLHQKIGEGGMAKVYLAEHVFLRENRAIKMIKRPDHRRESQYGRFLREARMARHVSNISPHVVRIDDFGYDQKLGVYYYSMEILSGKSLRETLREPPYYLPPERTVKIALQVCAAMALAHREGMIHRDIKPDNIFLINHNGQPDFVKILDFGLAKSLDPEEPDYTEVGKVVGTPEYMSPEQCRGPTADERVRRISHVDGRSDLYSLGVVLFQCLAGRAPFTLEGEPTPQNFLKLMSKQISEKPPYLLQLRKDIPQDLADIVKKALKKSPERRYQSMDELAQSLLQSMPHLDTPGTSSFSSLHPPIELRRILQSIAPPSNPSFANLQPFRLQIDSELDW